MPFAWRCASSTCIGCTLDDLSLVAHQERIHLVGPVPKRAARVLARVVSVPTRRALRAGPPLRAGARRVRAAVLPMRDAQVRVLGLVLDPVDGLDSVRDVREVHKGTVPISGRAHVQQEQQ